MTIGLSCSTSGVSYYSWESLQAIEIQKDIQIEIICCLGIDIYSIYRISMDFFLFLFLTFLPASLT